MESNAVLETMAEALFKSWFVDFDPVIDNALAAGNPIPKPFQARAERRKALLNASANADTAGLHTLPAELKQLFPDAFVETEELGWIPKGWRVGRYLDVAELNSDSWTNRNHPEYIKYVDLSNVNSGSIEEIAEYSFQDAPSRARRVLKKYDTIFGVVRPGNKSFAFILEDGLTGSTGFAQLRPKQECFRAFVYLGVTQNSNVEYLAHIADGAAYPAVRPDVVGNLLVTLPDAGLVKKFECLVSPLFKRMQNNSQECGTLRLVRDELLPKLLSGQLRLPEAESELAEAAQ